MDSGNEQTRNAAGEAMTPAEQLLRDLRDYVATIRKGNATTWDADNAMLKRIDAHLSTTVDPDTQWSMDYGGGPAPLSPDIAPDAATPETDALIARLNYIADTDDARMSEIDVTLREAALAIAKERQRAEAAEKQQRIREALYKEQFERAESLERQLAAEREKVRQYDELIFSVGKKYEDETRHQTALRYILNAERSNDNQASAARKEKP